MPRCNLLYNHACLSIDGNWTICCKFNDSKKYDASLYSFENFKLTDTFTSVKKTLETTWHPGCAKCIKDEQEYQIESLRQYSLRELSGKDQLEYLEINLSNDCNLNCRMCGPRYSSSWERFVEQNQNLDVYYNKELFQINHKQLDINKLFKNLDLSNLKTIKYLGGEPFVTKQINNLFEFLDSRNLLSQIEFQANTNCTLFPKKHIDYLKKFKKVIMTLSIDGVGKLNDYIRNGSNWKVVNDIVGKWKEFSQQHNCVLIISPTLLPYNVHDLTNIRLYCEQVGIKYKLHPLSFPERFRLDAVPLSYLKSIENDDNSLFISKSKFDQLYYNQLVDFTNKMDVATGKHLRNYVPELSRCFKI